jgi:hypothetical protein
MTESKKLSLKILLPSKSTLLIIGFSITEIINLLPTGFNTTFWKRPESLNLRNPSFIEFAERLLDLDKPEIATIVSEEISSLPDTIISLILN